MGNRADEEQRVEEALQDFFALYRIGETEEAESQWSNVESLIRELGAPPPAVIGVLVARAEFHTKRREFFAVEPLLARCLEIHRPFVSVPKPTDDDLLGWASFSLRQADLYLAQRTPQLALKPATEALQFTEQLVARSPAIERTLQEARVVCQIARVHRRLGHRDMAKDFYVRALRIYRKHFDRIKQESSLYDTITDLAIIYLEQGNTRLAKTLLNEVDDKLVQVFGENHRVCAESIARLAFVDRMEGNPGQTKLYDRAVSRLASFEEALIREYVEVFEQVALAKRFAGDELDAQIELAFVEAIRQRFPAPAQQIPTPELGQERTDLTPIVATFAAGDYAGTLRETEEFLGTEATLELVRVRLMALQRLQQHETVKTLSRNLMASTPDMPFEQALTKLLIGQLSRDDVLRMATNAKEYCQGIYFSAARARTEAGFEAARPELMECVSIDAKCVEKEIARMELAAADASAAVATVPAWEVGDLIDQTYRVRSQNTDGAMSLVYFVWHEKWNVELALKVPRPEAITGPDGWQRLSAEAQTWVDLGVHPNIVTAYYVRRFGGIPAIVMEKVDGGSLKDALKSGRLTELAKILDIAIQVARGLAYAGEKRPGFIHRDVKPANVLLTTRGAAKLADFGLANATGVVAGTPAYMAPEMWVRPAQVGPPADIYSFGAMLFEMLTGRRPFGRAVGDRFTKIPEAVQSKLLNPDITPDEAGNAYVSQATEIWPGEATRDLPPQHDSLTELMLAHLHAPPPDPQVIRSDIPLNVSHFCLRLLAKDPNERPTAAELVGELISLYENATKQEFSRAVPESAELAADTLNNQALSMLDLGREEEATRLWQQATAVNPLDAAVMFNTGLRAWRAAQITDADLLERLDDAGGSVVDSASISYLKSLVHLERGDDESILSELDGIKDSWFAGADVIEELRRKARERCSNRKTQLVTLDAHSDRIAAVRANRDGSSVFTASLDQTLKIWDINSRSCKVIGQHSATIVAADISQDWSTAVSIDAAGELRLWNTATCECSRTIELGRGFLGVVAISADGRFCVASDLAGLSNVWDGKTGRKIATLEGIAFGARAIVISSERDAAIITDRTSLSLWRLSTGEHLGTHTIPESFAVTRPIAFGRDGHRFVTHIDNVDIVLVDTATAHPIRRFQGHKDAVLSLSCPAELNCFASVGADATLRLWDIQTGRCRRTVTIEPSILPSSHMTADGLRIVIGTDKGHLLIFDWHNLATSAPFVLSRPLDADTLLEMSRVIRSAVSASRVQLDAGQFAAAAETIRKARGHTGCRRHPELLAVWFELYSRLFQTSLNGIWKQRTFAGHDTFVQSVRLSEDRNRMVSVARNGVIQIWDATTGECLRTLHLPPSVSGESPSVANLDRLIKADLTWSADLSTDGRLIAVAGGDGGIRLFEASTGECVRTIIVGDIQVLVTRLTHNQDRVVSGCSDGTVHVHDVSTGSHLQLIQGHTDAVTALAIRGDDQQFVTTGEDQTIRVWTLRSGVCLQMFGAEESGPLVPANLYNLHSSGSDNRIRALIRDRIQYLHLPMRLRARRALALCIDQTGSFVLRAIGSRLELWDVAASSLMRSIETPAKLILHADMTPNARFAVSVGDDRRLCVWNLATGVLVQSTHTQQEPWSVHLSRDARFVFCGEFGDVTQWILDWELTEQVSDTTFPNSDLPQESTSVETTRLIELVDALISSANNQRNDWATQVAQIPWEQLKATRQPFVDRMPLLVECLFSAESTAVEQACCYLLSAVGSAALNPLRKGLQDPKPQVRKFAAMALSQFGAAAESAIQDLVSLLRDHDSEVVQAATYALFSIGPHSILELCRELQSRDRRVQALSLFTLSKFGPMACSAVPAIERAAAESDDPNFRKAARKTLDQIINPDQKKDDTAETTSLRGCLGCLAILGLVIGIAWWGIGRLLDENAKTHAQQEAKTSAERKLRHAADIIGMWTRPISLGSPPSLRPEQATLLLNEIAASAADDNIKQQASDLQQTMRHYEHYLKFANQFSQLSPQLQVAAELFETLAERQNIAKNSPDPTEPLQPGIVVLTMPSRSINDEPDSLDSPSLDAEMMNACGDRCATSPDDLHTLVVLQWSKKRIGDRKTVISPGTKSIGKAARYLYRCRLTAISLASQKVTFSRSLEQADAETQTLFLTSKNYQFREDASQDGHLQLRKSVQKELIRLSGAGDVPRTNQQEQH